MARDCNKRQDEAVDEWERHLHWSATGHRWWAKTDEAFISVSEQTYEQHLSAYLESRGIEWKTWSEIMEPAEEAWRLQCEAVQAFQADLEQWLNSDDPGVHVIPRSER